MAQYVRYETSLAKQFQRWYGKGLQIAHLSFVFLPIFFFAIGAGWVVYAVWDFREIPPIAPPAAQS
jgi:hypothetical protein